MKLWVKIVLSVLSVAVALIGGFIVMIVVAMGGGGNFYTAVSAICAIILLLFVIAQIWGLLKRRTRFIIFVVPVCIVLLSVAGFEVNKAYVNSIEEVNEQDVDLTLYEPFRSGTKAVSLDEESTLKLSGDLPRLDGATALYPLYSAFARAVYPEADYPSIEKKDDALVICTKTDNAYWRLIRGEADIIFAAAPSIEQLQMAADEGVELKRTPIGREAFVFFVNAKNPVNGLSVEDIQKIYSGEAKNWSEFGGKNAEIKAFQRPVNSGSQTALVNIMHGVPLMEAPGKDVAGIMGGMVRRVSSYKNYNSAIGYSFLFFATEMVNDDKIKLLSINGIAPSRENVANDTYPYVSDFYAVTAGTDNPNAERLIEWILSGQGQYLVEKTGYTPINGKLGGGDEKVGYKKVTAEEARSKMAEDAVVLDVRTQEEYDEGHIEGAVLLPDYEIASMAGAVLPDKNKTVLVYCRSGNRSKTAAKQLIEKGYSQVYDFGGIMDWPYEVIK